MIPAMAAAMRLVRQVVMVPAMRAVMPVMAAVMRDARLVVMAAVMPVMPVMGAAMNVAPVRPVMPVMRPVALRLIPVGNVNHAIAVMGAVMAVIVNKSQ